MWLLTLIFNIATQLLNNIFCFITSFHISKIALMDDWFSSLEQLKIMFCSSMLIFHFVNHFSCFLCFKPSLIAHLFEPLLCFAKILPHTNFEKKIKNKKSLFCSERSVFLLISYHTYNYGHIYKNPKVNKN